MVTNEVFINTNLKREVIILGAGSSYPYGLPLGSHLKYLIENFDIFIGYYKGLHSRPGTSDFPIISPTINRHPKRNKLKADLDQYDFDKIEERAGQLIEIAVTTGLFTIEELENFINHLKNSESSTIDAFISSVGQNQEKLRDCTFTIGQLNEKIGKILIGFFISTLQCSYLPPDKNNDDWIQYFIDTRVAYHEDDFCSNPPIVISFNYDRIFYSKIMNKLSVSRKMEKMKSWDYLHVYGQVEVSPDPISYDEIKGWYESISTISRSNPSTAQELIRSKIQTATDIYILGYGFDKFNNKVLFENVDSMKALFEHCSVSSTGIMDDPCLNWLNNFADEVPTFSGGGLKKVIAHRGVNSSRLLSSIAMPKSFF